MKKTTLFLALLLMAVTASASIKNVKYATFGTPGSNASYDATTGSYSWTNNNDNLMQMFSFENGELDNYTKLTLNITATSGNVRVNFVYGTGSSDHVSYNGTSEGGYFGSTGTKEISLSGLETVLKSKSKTLSDVTAIRFGGDGSSKSGTWTIKWSDVYLENDDDAVVTALFVAPTNSASYNVPSYGCTNVSSNNLMDVYTGSAGDFSKYSNGVLQFTISNLSSGNMVRIGYHNGTTFSDFGDGFGSSGTKTVDISGQYGNAAAATTIKFGAKSGTAASPFVTIRPDQMFLVRSEAYTRSFTQDKKSTVWLPFALTADEVAAVAGKFYELTATDGTTLTFTEVTGDTEAYKPYVFVASSTGTPFSGMKSKTIVAPKTCAYTVGDYTFMGAMKETKVPDDAYGYQDDKFVQANGTNVGIMPFRAYIVANTSKVFSRGMLDIDLQDGTTGIDEAKVNVAQPQDDAIYNLAGQKVDAGYKGIVIKNGKKMIVR